MSVTNVPTAACVDTFSKPGAIARGILVDERHLRDLVVNAGFPRRSDGLPGVEAACGLDV